jgi:CheY-like chemotaxis protein
LLYQSTTHVLRGGVEPRRVGDWLQFAVALAPSGFDQDRDGVCIHRGGTVLYFSAGMPRLLGLRGAAPWVGCRLVDLLHPADREGVASALTRGEAEGCHLRDGALRVTARVGGRRVEIHALHAVGSTPPVDFLYVCAPPGAAFGEGEGTAAGRDGGSRRQKAARPTVLICDDEARLCALTAGLLTEFGFAPITAGTGDDALRTLAAGNPGVDVVLLDVNLSAGRSAREVLAEMRDTGAEARVILTSGLAEEDVDDDLLSHPSVVSYIAKPYGVDDLVQSINRALGRPTA